MKKVLSQKLFIAVFWALISIFCAGDSYAFSVGARPFYIVLTGTIIPLEERRDSRTFDLKAGENIWRFKVTRANNTGSSGVTGWRILQDLFPRVINLVGDQKIIQPLMQPEVLGKNFEFKGRLYLQSRKYFLSSVTEVLEEADPPELE